MPSIFIRFTGFVPSRPKYYIVVMNVKLSTRANRQFNRHKGPVRAQLAEALLGLEEEPPRGDIKRLNKGPADYRLRSGDYRIFFNILDSKIIVDKIYTRGHAYKNRR